MKHSIGWLFAILLVLGAVAASKTAGSGPYGIDASYYFQVARHVAHGDGLITTISVYHEGWHLPARSAMCPLWPLTLGYAGRAMGMVRAANVLPKFFYLLDLVLLYALCRVV